MFGALPGGGVRCSPMVVYVYKGQYVCSSRVKGDSGSVDFVD